MRALCMGFGMVLAKCSTTSNRTSLKQQLWYSRRWCIVHTPTWRVCWRAQAGLCAAAAPDPTTRSPPAAVCRWTSTEDLRKSPASWAAAAPSAGASWERRDRAASTRADLTHTHTHTHTHDWSAILVGTLHRCNVFYTVQTVFSIALHQPYTRTHTHTRTHRHTQARTHTHTRQTRTHTHTHTHTHRDRDADSHARTHAHTHAHAHAHTERHTHRHTQTHTHTHTDTHTHRHTHVLQQYRLVT